MKSLIAKLLPGVVATIAVLLGGAYMARAQHSHHETPAPAAVAAVAPEMARPIDQGKTGDRKPETGNPAVCAPREAITLCGACGEQLQAPRPVHVAQPVYAERRREATGYAWSNGSRVPDPAYYPGNVGPHAYRVQHVPVWPQPLFSAATVTAPVYAPTHYGRY